MSEPNVACTYLVDTRIAELERQLAETQAKLATATACLVRIRDSGVMWTYECKEQARETLKEIGHD